MSDRLEKLQTMLSRQPNDAFLLYAIGMEYRKANDPARAIEYFDKTIAADAGYCYAYFQKGQTLESAGDIEAARQTYRDGVAAAQKKGDAHAGEEISAALAASMAG